MSKSKALKKIMTVGLSLMLAVLMLTLSACGKPPEEAKKIIGNEDMGGIKTNGDAPRINGSDVIVVVNPSKTKSLTGKSRLSNDETAMLISLQGIVAQTKAEIYVGKETDTMLQYIANNYGKTIEVIDDMAELIDRYKDHVSEYGYIKIKLQNSVTTSLLNQASTLAAANKWLIVPVASKDDTALENALKDRGFTLKQDYYFAKAESEITVIEQNKDKLNTKVMAAISPIAYNSRDYGIAMKAPFFFYRTTTTSQENYRKVYGMLNPLATVVGWQNVVVQSGDTKVQQGAEHKDWATVTADAGVLAIPVSDINNLSLYASIKQEGNLQQKETRSNAGDNVHYATIIYNNGEDMGEFLKFIEDTNMFAVTEKTYPVGWTINASLYDYIPMAMRYAYENMTDNEYFVAYSAGLSRTNIGLLEEHGKPYGSTLQAYLDRTNDLLGKAGLPYISYLGGLSDVTKVDKKSVMELFGKLSNVKGGFVLSPDNVTPTGGVKWIDGKPFVADREIIRDYPLLSPQQQEAAREVKVSKTGKRSVSVPTFNRIATKTAERLAQYEVNPSSIEGYSVVQVHGSYNYKNLMKNFYEKLDTNKVRIVTPDEFMRLLEQNITDKKDVSSVKILSTEKEPEIVEE